VAGAASAAPPSAFTLTLTPTEVNEIGVALGRQPYADVADLMSKLKSQVTAETIKAASPPAATTAETPPGTPAEKPPEAASPAPAAAPAK
jgi:hypothetical protein